MAFFDGRPGNTGRLGCTIDHPTARGNTRWPWRSSFPVSSPKTRPCFRRRRASMTIGGACRRLRAGAALILWRLRYRATGFRRRRGPRQWRLDLYL